MEHRITGRRRGNHAPGFTLIEILIVIAIIGVLAAIVMPKAADAIAQARESAALQHIKAIHAAQATYFARRGEYAASLTELGPPPPGSGLLPSELARGEKLGYRFTLAANTASEGYAITVTPAASASWFAARRSFYSDGSLVIRATPAAHGQATADSPELGASSTAPPAGR